MIGCFIGGVFVGGFIGVMIMCVLSVAGQSDCDYDETKCKMKKDTENNDDVL